VQFLWIAKGYVREVASSELSNFLESISNRKIMQKISRTKSPGVSSYPSSPLWSLKRWNGLQANHSAVTRCQEVYCIV
jgi:hypothetical protein